MIRTMVVAILVAIICSVAFVGALPEKGAQEQSQQAKTQEILTHVTRNFLSGSSPECVSDVFFEQVHYNPFHLIAHCKGRCRADLCAYLFKEGSTMQEYRERYIQSAAVEFAGQEEVFIPYLATVKHFLQWNNDTVSPLERFIRTVWFKDSDAIASLYKNPHERRRSSDVDRIILEPEDQEKILLNNNATIEQIHHIVSSFMNHGVFVTDKKYLIPLFSILALRARHGYTTQNQSGEHLVDKQLSHIHLPPIQNKFGHGDALMSYVNGAAYLFLAHSLCQKEWEDAFCPRKNPGKCTLSNAFSRYVCDGADRKNALIKSGLNHKKSPGGTMEKIPLLDEAYASHPTIKAKIARAHIFRSDVKSLLLSARKRYLAQHGTKEASPSSLFPWMWPAL